ncbi:hypothetical protein X777_09828, partial [Ooceraea biroi]
NEFTCFFKSIPGWITVDAHDSRHIKTATDKFLPGRAGTKNRLLAEMTRVEDGLGRSLHPARLDLRKCGGRMPKSRRREAARERASELISSHWLTLSFSQARWKKRMKEAARRRPIGRGEVEPIRR